MLLVAFVCLFITSASNLYIRFVMDLFVDMHLACSGIHQYSGDHSAMCTKDRRDWRLLLLKRYI